MKYAHIVDVGDGNMICFVDDWVVNVGHAQYIKCNAAIMIDDARSRIIFDIDDIFNVAILVNGVVISGKYFLK